MKAAELLDLQIKSRGGAAAVVEANVPTARRLDFAIVADLPAPEDAFDDELVEGLIGRSAMAVMYGDSNSGKTFLVIEISARLSLAEPVLGKRTPGGAVLYLATEAPQSVQMRAKVWERHNGVSLDRVVIVRSPINLFDGAADTEAVVALVAQVEQMLGEQVVLIVGDTLSRMSAGANENSGEDMGVVIRNADAIRAATGATFLWVHHTGKDAAKGMRGWSGMRAAIDTELEVTADDATGLRALEVTKQRDLPGKGTRIGFRLEAVAIGRNRWGEERTSCIVAPSDAPAARVRAKRVSEIAGAITELLSQHGAGILKGRIVKHFEGRYHHSAVYREIKAMTEDGRLIESTGVVALPGRPAVGGGAE